MIYPCPLEPSPTKDPKIQAGIALTTPYPVSNSSFIDLNCIRILIFRRIQPGHILIKHHWKQYISAEYKTSKPVEVFQRLYTLSSLSQSCLRADSLRYTAMAKIKTNSQMFCPPDLLWRSFSGILLSLKFVYSSCCAWSAREHQAFWKAGKKCQSSPTTSESMPMKFFFIEMAKALMEAYRKPYRYRLNEPWIYVAGKIMNTVCYRKKSPIMIQTGI